METSVNCCVQLVTDAKTINKIYEQCKEYNMININEAWNESSH